MHAIIACEKQEQRDPFRQILINCGVDCGAEDAVLFDDLLPRINRGGAELLLIHLGARPLQTLKLVADVHAKKALPILVVGPGDDAQIIMRAMSVGAREYLDASILRESLAKTLEKLRQSGAIQVRRGQCIAVTSAVPGSGVTTLASGLAFALAAEYPKQVLLGEIGAGVPELAFDLDLTVRNSVTQLLQDWDRVDASTIRQAAVPHADGVFVLADSPQEQPDLGNAGAVKQLTALIRTMYDFGVYDIGHAVQTPAAEQIVRLAEHIVVVVRLDVPSLRLTRALLNRLTDAGIPPERLIVVANRYGQRGQVHWRKVEESLGVAISAWVPEDPATVNQALNLGVPLQKVSSWGKLIRSMKDLAKLTVGAAKK